METAFDAVLEIFGWVGVGAGLLLAIAAVIMWAAQGTWLSAEAVLDEEAGHLWVRWFDNDGDANSAIASAHDREKLAGLDKATIWYRMGWHGRMRLTRTSPALAAVAWLAVGCLGVGLLSFAASLVLLFVRG